MKWLERLADRIHAPHDEHERAQGLTVTRLPGGKRSVSHPELPALLEARRRCVAAERATHDDDRIPA